jgi:hypothetical protein
MCQRAYETHTPAQGDLRTLTQPLRFANMRDLQVNAVESEA